MPFMPFRARSRGWADGAAFETSLAQTTNTSATGLLVIHILLPDEPVAAIDLAGRAWPCCRGRSRGRARSGQAANPLAAGQLGRYFCLRFGAEFMDGHHHQRTLHAGHRAVARVHALHLAGDQAIGHVRQAGAAVLLQGWWGPAGPLRPSRGRC